MIWHVVAWLRRRAARAELRRAQAEAFAVELLDRAGGVAEEAAVQARYHARWALEAGGSDCWRRERVAVEAGVLLDREAARQKHVAKVVDLASVRATRR